VNNEKRCAAGRAIWKMPKMMASVELRIHRDDAELHLRRGGQVETETLGWTVTSGAPVDVGPLALGLRLADGRVTELAFKSAFAPLDAVLHGSGFSERGALTLLCGDAVLAAASLVDEELGVAA
jgi:hypothetical protein